MIDARMLLHRAHVLITAVCCVKAKGRGLKRVHGTSALKSTQHDPQCHIACVCT